VVQDWKREAEPIQQQIDSSSEIEQFWHIAQAFNNLQTCYLKCLFSYVLFFVALVNAYDLFYEELNAINRITNLHIKHDKRPKANMYIDKVRKIRNISIAHLGSKETSPIDSVAAMMWQPLTLNKGHAEPWDINKFTFSEGTLSFRDMMGNVIAQSSDMEIGGIIELNERCMEFLDEYDRTCATYLENIVSKLPVTIDNIQYRGCINKDL